jgi:UDP-2-acetamido-2-deoxy-ribo-hexuluronate aminotransferase
MHKIEMVDLKRQFNRLRIELESAVLSSIHGGQFINGSNTQTFAKNLAKYNEVKHCIPVANGTDALQIALMSLDLKKGDEILVPAFTYVATAEVIALLGLKPIMVDCNTDDFNINIQSLIKNIKPKTRAIVPVHLFGQSCEMDEIMEIAKKNQLFVIEDNAQSIGAKYKNKIRTGAIGDIACTSFYPSKNLGAYGDGGAITTNNDDLAEKIKAIANHGQSKTRYYHDTIGVNSRLDDIQAAILNIKLDYLDNFIERRQKAAELYDRNLKGIKNIIIPKRAEHSNHVFHQYTIQVKGEKREALQMFLNEKGIPNMIYYPVPLYKQKAYSHYVKKNFKLKNTEKMCNSVLSLPMHTELEETQIIYICNAIRSFYKS